MDVDYYLIGHCICHVGGKWSITVSSGCIDYLVKGLESQTATGQSSTCSES